MKLKCLIVDDELLARKGLEEFVAQTPFLELKGSLGSAIQALEFLKSNPVDIMFLDIQMPNMTGLELIKSLNLPPKVIFTTAYREFALEGFDLNAVDYLLKPFSYPRFLKAIDKVNLMNEPGPIEDSHHIFIKSNGILVRIPVDDIIFVETAKDYVFVHTLSEKYLTLVSLGHIENQLPESKFMRVHRSYLVGLTHVKKIEGSLLYVENHKIRISKNLRKQVYDRIIGDSFIGRF
ncbi:LytR/AlgR family response regulator transcription factor [Flagellimonas meishanensis]|uniref:LytR/AlgR family response regulator transcription factor n=1 Tax=Flagellimonas meishanensis TaxID=2873264 RepID=UPI001CA6A70C|nr:LytTR family DNA-binding domain-containing protein [[Muricauda] meishanensis]